ncbi:MAG: hypothetical protein V7607_5809 [Solirubrobacteraceae bacterium]
MVLWVWILGAAVAALVLPYALSADMAWHLQWGIELNHGELPTYGTGLAGPTLHPLGLLLGSLAGATGHGYDVLALAGPVSFAGVVVMTWRLGWVSFGLLGGIVAAALAAVTASVMDYTLTFFVDSAFVVVVLMGVTLIAVAPDRGIGPLVAFGIAGLLRPEAWLFSAVYWVYVAFRGVRVRRLVLLTILAASGGILWALCDLVVAGDLLYSLTRTQEGARKLDRTTGLGHVPKSLIDFVRDGVRPGIMIGASAAFVLVMVLRRRSMVAIAGFTATAGCTYVVLGAADVSLLPRYTIAFQVGLTLLFAWLVTGWEHESTHRRAWLIAATAAAAAALVSVHSRANSVDRSVSATQIRQDAVNGLNRIAHGPTVEHFSRVCRPRGVVDALAQPFLEYFSSLPPGSYSFERFTAQRTGIKVTTENARILGSFSLTAPDDTRPGPGFRRVAANASWEAAVKDC